MSACDHLSPVLRDRMSAAVNGGRWDEVIDLVRAHGVPPAFVPEGLGQNLVHGASMVGRRTAILGELLAIDPSLIDKRCEGGYAPLHWAAIQGNTENVRLLLDRGADIEAKDFIGSTPLVLAARRNKAGTVALLISRGADLSGLVTAKGRIRSWVMNHPATLSVISATIAELAMAAAISTAPTRREPESMGL